MRMSRLFSQTLRDVPGEAELPSHQLLLKAGLVRPLSAGSYSYLPLARRALTKIEDIIREEMDAIGGQEITMPVVHPATLWQETGRWYQVGPEMARFKDRAERDMVLAMTHEEVIADLVRQEVRSYRQLPCLLYQIQTKYRDEPRARGGLIRVREFTMKDSYSLDADWEGLDAQYRAHYQAYFNIFQRCHVPVIAVRSDVGMMGGQLAHEYMYLNPIGEDTLVLCDRCGYAANRQVAAARLPAAAAEGAVAERTCGDPGHADHRGAGRAPAGAHGAHRQGRCFFMATMAGSDGEDDRERFVFAVVRGDSELNETKLANALGARDLRPAREEEIRAVGAQPGYGLAGRPAQRRPAGGGGRGHPAVPQPGRRRQLARLSPCATRNYGRDYTATQVTDLVMARDGDDCAQCDGVLRTSRGVEVGNIFKLGTRYTDALGAVFPRQRRQQQNRSSWARTASAAAGCCRASSKSTTTSAASAFRRASRPTTCRASRCCSAPRKWPRRRKGCTARRGRRGVEMLLDDRDATPGVKFNDADLIGLPLRLTLGARSLRQGGAELKARDSDDSRHRAAGQGGADPAGRGGPAAGGKPGAGCRSAVRRLARECGFGGNFLVRGPARPLAAHVPIQGPPQGRRQVLDSQGAGAVEFVQRLVVPAQAHQGGAPVVVGGGVLRVLLEYPLEMTQGRQRLTRRATDWRPS